MPRDRQDSNIRMHHKLGFHFRFGDYWETILDIKNEISAEDVESTVEYEILGNL